MNGFFEYVIEHKAVYPGLEANTWEEALLKGGAYLVNSGIVRQEYIDTMIEKVTTMGPYFLLAPGIAMPHGRAEEGVERTGYALVTLAEPVYFGDEDNDPIWMMIFMAAKDRKTHNEIAIAQIAELCDSEDAIEKIWQAKNKNEILDVLAALQKELEE